MSFSDQPRRGPHPVDHDAHRRTGGEVAQLDQAAGQPGQADRVGAADHHDLVGHVERARASSGCGPGREPNSAARSCSRLKPVSTTTWPCSRATSSRCSTTPARTSTHRSARGRPVTTVRCGPTARAAPSRTARRASRRPSPGPPTAGPTPRRGCRAAGRPRRRRGRRRRGRCGSRRRASSAARPVATVVRPGAPAGPHTAITRPATAGEPVASLVGLGRRGRRCRPAPRRRPRRRAATRARPRRPATGSRSGSPAGRRRRAPAPPGTIATGRTAYERRWSTAADVEAGRVDAEHGDVRPGRRWRRPAGRRRRRSA